MLMLKHTLTAAAMAALLTTPGLAQQPAPDTDKQMQSAPDKGMNKDMMQSAPGMNKDMKSESTSQDATSKQGAMKTEDKADGAKSDSAMTNTAASGQQAGFLRSQEANEWRGSELIGASVEGSEGESIGEINDVLIGKDGRLTAAVVGVGGFLGVGEKNVALPFQALNVERKDGEVEKITVSYSKEQLNNAPSFAYLEDEPAQTTGAGVGSKPDQPMAPKAGAGDSNTPAGSMNK